MWKQVVGTEIELEAAVVAPFAEGVYLTMRLPNELVVLTLGWAADVCRHSKSRVDIWTLERAAGGAIDGNPVIGSEKGVIPV